MEKFRLSVLNALLNHSNRINATFLVHNYIWNISHDNSHFTFLDIIKGIVPGFLSQKIYEVTNNRKLVLDYLHCIYDELYIDLKTNIWQPRCDAMIQKEITLGITKKIKKKKYRNNLIYNSSSTFRSLAQDNLFQENFGLDLEIKIGGNWLGFTIVRNHSSKSVGLVILLLVRFT